MSLETRIQHWPDESTCAASARALAARIAGGGAGGGGGHNTFIELHGPLGAGKTTFARHLLQALGVQGRIKSPTYAVLESYPVEWPLAAGLSTGADAGAIHHFDFYRFDDPQEWEDAGFRDVFAAPGLKLAEWPDKAAGLLPVADLQVHIEPLDRPGGDSDAGVDDGAAGQEPRAVRFVAQTALGLRLLPDGPAAPAAPAAPTMPTAPNAPPVPTSPAAPIPTP